MILFIFLIAIVSILSLFCSTLAYALGHYLLCDWTSWVGWAGVTTVSFVIIVLPVFKALEAAVLAVRDMLLFTHTHRKVDPGDRLDDGRRRFLQVSMNVGLVAISGSLALHGLSEAMSLPRVKELDIGIEDLPLDLDGFTIVQITDLHISPAIRRNWVQRLVERVNTLDPDMIALTGDIADGSPSEIGYDSAPLAGLTARFGKFFVTGNHEYMHGADEWMREMRKMGFTVLFNDHRLIQLGGGQIVVGGVADYSAPSRSSHPSSPFQALGEAAGRDVKILLAHQPRSVYEAARAGFDLQLSGHTHGGQFGPGAWLRSFGQPFQSGLYTYKDTQIYVSNGAGYWGLPVRLGAPSEISLLKLTRIVNSQAEGHGN